MERNDVVVTLEKYLQRAIGDLPEGGLDTAKSLLDYGANSLDIVEVVSSTMRELRIKIPRPELNDIENLEGLIDVFMKYSVEKVA